MNEKNIGNVERVIRVVFAVGLTIWILSQPSFSLTEAFVALTAFFLFLNGVFSRCYLWFVLEVNTTPRIPGHC